MKLPQEQEETLSQYYGKEVYKHLKHIINIYEKRWNLSNLLWINHVSCNCLFTCTSNQHGEVILKICPVSIDDMIAEYYALVDFSGREICQVYEFSPNDNIMLIEKITPGYSLKNETNIATRLSIFTDLFNQLHTQPSKQMTYKTYTSWIEKITAYMSYQNQYKDLYQYMYKAYQSYLELIIVYQKKLLLHGDFHYHNILMNENNNYTIIDPKGVIGDPIFDVGRYITNECWDNKNLSLQKQKQLMKYIFNHLESHLHINKKVLKQCFFIEITMANCWSVEDKEIPDIEDVKFAYELLNIKE